MNYCYNRLWKLLIDREMNKRDLSRLSGVSESTLGRMRQGEQVGLNVLAKIASSLGCGIDDILEISPLDE